MFPLAFCDETTYPYMNMMRFAAAFLGMASWGFATIFSIAYPLPDSLGPGSLPPVWTWGWILILIGVVGYSLWLKFPREKDGTSFLPLVLSLAFQLVLVCLAGSFLHRDFFTLLFQAVAIHFGLFIGDLPSTDVRLYAKTVDRIFFFTIIIVAFFLFWIALMGFAIASRKEPRWIPSIGYNVHNLLICLYISIANLRIRDFSKRKLIVSSDALTLDGIDLLSLFSPSVRKLVVHFLSLPGGEGLVCAEAQFVINGKKCEKDCSKATICPDYRYLYNRIHEIRKIFTALKIGTIVSPENRQTILEKGWCFVPDPSIRIYLVKDEGKKK